MRFHALAALVVALLALPDEAALAYTQFLARAPKAFAPQIAAVQKRLGGSTAPGR